MLIGTIHIIYHIFSNINNYLLLLLTVSSVPIVLACVHRLVESLVMLQLAAWCRISQKGYKDTLEKTLHKKCNLTKTHFMEQKLVKYFFFYSTILFELLSGSVPAIIWTLCCRPWWGISYRCVFWVSSV